MKKQKNLFEKITFILPILERKKFSLRIVRYLSKLNFKINIIIADGSKKNQEKYFLTLKKKHNLIFKKFPYDKNPFYFLVKLYKSTNLVHTKYTAFMENDEIMNFENYKFLVNFMEKNPRFTYTTGKIINFDLTKENNIVIAKKQCHDSFGELYKSSFHLNSQPQCVEGVHKTKNFNLSLKYVLKSTDKKIDMVSFSDFLNIFTVAQGDVKFFQNKTISFRQANTKFYEENDKISSSVALAKVNKIRTILYFKSLKYHVEMYKILIKLTGKNLKIMFIKYHLKRVLIFLYSDLKKILKFIIKIFSFKNLNNKNRINLVSKSFPEITIYGYNYLNKIEKNKIKKIIKYFHI